MKINELFDKYLALCEKNDDTGCGDLVYDLEDSECKELYERLVADERTKDKLVNPLWFNYKTQTFRW